ncbi:hypothetical protein IQ07DRAFT_677932 [Pyrenochaeta sp. DS3sAY3a]|nr:hypothetical protein IQ07DRAFT_677932 [Pyrenochaeta sp. DS3sAY3a]
MAQIEDNKTEVTPKPEYCLILYSHGRSPPLFPAPDLKYDLRSIPNPPKALREVSDGRSKRLREHLLSEPKFVDKLRDVEADIRRAMQEKTEEWELEKFESEQIGETDDEKNDDQNQEDKKKGQPKDMDQGDEDEDEESSGDEDEDDEQDDSKTEPENTILLRVGCNCALGHHRSVAFVHELSQLPWPKEWHVEVIHRDLEVKRAGGTRERQKARFRGKGRGFLEHEDA